MSDKKKPYRIEGRPQTIYRVVKSPDNPYVMIDRRPIENPALSFKAKGILAYLLSRPDGWEVSVSDLINKAVDGEDSVRSGMAELESVGHLKRTRTRAAGAGTYTGLLIEVYEVPHSDYRHVVKPDVVKPDVENPTQVLKTLSTTELKKNEAVAAVAVACSENRIKVKHSAIVKAVDAYPVDWIMDAMREACTANVLKFNYALAILARWKDEGKNETRKADKRNAKRVKEYTEADLEAARLINARA